RRKRASGSGFSYGPLTIGTHTCAMSSDGGVADLTAVDVPEPGGRTKTLDVLAKRGSNEEYEASPLSRLGEVIQLIHVPADRVEPSEHAPVRHREGARRHQPIELRYQLVESRGELPEEPPRLSQAVDLAVRFDRSGQRTRGQAKPHSGAPELSRRE